MKGLLYLLTAIILVAAFGVISIGCSCAPSNDVIKQAVIAACERDWGIHLTQEDIKIEEVGQRRIIPGGLVTIDYYPVKVSNRGHEYWFRLLKESGEWVALEVP